MERQQADLRAIAQAAWRAGVAAVDPGLCVARHLARRRDLPPDSPSTLVVAVGKAAAAMLRGAMPVARGLVLCPAGSDVADLPAGVEVLYGGHPVPTAQGIESSRRIAAAVAQLGEDETLLFLLSGGASSLLEVPCQGLSIDDAIAAYRALVTSGASINEINGVRRCLSAVKGGALLGLAAPARVCTLALSDVVGDDPAAIGSGPTFPAPSDGAHAAREALEIIARYAIAMPAGVLAHLQQMATLQAVTATTTCNDAGSGPGVAVDYEIVAGVADAVRGAAELLQGHGCSVQRRASALTGDTESAAAEAGEQIAAMLAKGLLLDRSAAAPAGTGAGAAAARAWLAGGETIVRLPPSCSGRGGRNLDLAARLALALAGRRGFACVVAGTDGRDGSSRAAGAVIDGGTADRAQAAGFPLVRALQAFDTEPALEAAGDLLVTGATGTNVGDLLVAVAQA